MDTRICSIEEEKYYREFLGGMQKAKKPFSYEGPVLYLGNVIQRYWCAATYAVSDKKARSNLVYQYKVEHGLPINASIDLPGVIMVG